MKPKYQHIHSTDRYSPEYSQKMVRDFKRVLWINAIGFLSLITAGVYVWEIKEFGNNFATFILRHGNFFGPVTLAFVCYLIYKKVKP